MDINIHYAAALKDHQFARHPYSNSPNNPECDCFRRGWAAAVPDSSGKTVGDLPVPDDTLSDAAYLDECAMRALAALITSEPEIAENHVAQASYGYAAAMLAERKRRREGGA